MPAKRPDLIAELFVTSADERDYTDALCWYAERSLQTAERFEAAIDKTLEAIAADPQRFPLCDDRHRYYLLERFPYQIIYRIQQADIWVIAMAHTSRESTFWSKQ